MPTNDVEASRYTVERKVVHSVAEIVADNQASLVLFRLMPTWSTSTSSSRNWCNHVQLSKFQTVSIHLSIKYTTNKLCPNTRRLQTKWIDQVLTHPNPSLSLPTSCNWGCLLPWVWVAQSIANITAGVGPQSLRGLPNGFPSQQQLPQNRSVSNRLPQAGKLGMINLYDRKYMADRVAWI